MEEYNRIINKNYMKKQRKPFYWRKLDDQAKIFTLATNEKYTSVFRLSIVLKENIREEHLKRAVIISLKKYMVFKVKMKKGLFWYYLEENEKDPIVSLETEYPFKKINTKENNEYLFKITYFQNKINLDFFHALTDGNGGVEFLKEIVYTYIKLAKSKGVANSQIQDRQVINKTENAYKKRFNKINIKRNRFKEAYMIKGEQLPRGQVDITHFVINLKEMLQLVQLKKYSLSMYLVAMLAYSIFENNSQKHYDDKSINICVPINLKKYFSSNTLSNFFSHMIIKIPQVECYNFDNVLTVVKKEFEKELNKEKIIETSSVSMRMINNIFVRITPLFLKKILVRLGSLKVKKHFTMTFSNMGNVEFDKKYSGQIDNMLTILSPDWAEKSKCGVCSFENHLIVTLSTLLRDKKIENKFEKILKNNNISYNIERNYTDVISY